jgi:hypothetical protein
MVFSFWCAEARAGDETADQKFSNYAALACNPGIADGAAREIP